jgi:hypothetical protein
MIWRVLALIGAGSFFVNGLSLVSDPSCVSADFGGGRVIQVTCRSDTFGTFSGTEAGLISLLIGISLLVLIFFRQIRVFLLRLSVTSERKYPPIDNPQIDIDASITDSQTKKCPMCAEEIKFEAMKCRFCQHSFVETEVQKFKNSTSSAFRKAFSAQFLPITIVFIIIGLIGVGIGLNERSKSIERNQLLAFGEVCVESYSGTVNYGCADYPNYKFSFCSDSPYGDLNFTDDYQLIGESYTKGGTLNTCAITNPYDYDYEGVTDKLSGEYEISVWDYTKPEFVPGDMSSGGTFLMTIKLKD